MSEGYQTTGHKEFWLFATLLVIVGVGMAMSLMLGKFMNSVWIVVVFGFATRSVFRGLCYKTNRLGNAPVEHYSGWRRYINSRWIGVLGFGLLSSFYIFNPFSNAIGPPDYAKAFIGGMWLLFTCDEFRLWYASRKAN